MNQVALVWSFCLHIHTAKTTSNSHSPFCHTTWNHLPSRFSHSSIVRKMFREAICRVWTQHCQEDVQRDLPTSSNLPRTFTGCALLGRCSGRQSAGCECSNARNMFRGNLQGVEAMSNVAHWHWKIVATKLSKQVPGQATQQIQTIACAGGKHKQARVQAPNARKRRNSRRMFRRRRTPQRART